MIEKYLGTRDSLKALVLLIDIRHAPTKDDVMMFNWVVENGLTPIIVATKLDKIKRSQKDKQLKLLRDTLGIKNDIKIVPYSSETKQGREELLDILSLFL